MNRACGPRGIDEAVVNVLLDVVDDPREVFACVVHDPAVVPCR